MNATQAADVKRAADILHDALNNDDPANPGTVNDRLNTLSTNLTTIAASLASVDGKLSTLITAVGNTQGSVAAVEQRCIAIANKLPAALDANGNLKVAVQS